MSTEPTPEEIAEARAVLTDNGRDYSQQTHFLLGWVMNAVETHNRAGFDPERNRAALAMIRAYKQLRGEEAAAAEKASES